MTPFMYFIYLFSGLLFFLLIGHAVADFALQSDFMAKHKNRHFKPEYIPPGQIPQTIWPYVLTSHALIHGGAVLLITGNIFLGIAETIAHWIIDFGNCENWYGIHADQLLHLICKMIWATLCL